MGHLGSLEVGPRMKQGGVVYQMGYRQESTEQASGCPPRKETRLQGWALDGV